ncbi:hypothetical protein D3C87_298710 [compost metagenome]
MNRRTIIMLTVLPLTIVSCKKTSRISSPTAFISKDTANKMIASYLGSIPTGNDTNLHSWVIDMDQIRLYDELSTGANRLKSIKIMLAHKLEYINSGHANEYAGYRNNALTVIVSGINAAGDYVYFSTDNVIDHSNPCPRNCPAGTAASPSLP